MFEWKQNQYYHTLASPQAHNMNNQEGKARPISGTPHEV